MATKEQALVIRHVGERQFIINREDGKASSPVQLTAPDELRVEGRPDGNLLQDLRWYLERFLDYPFEPNTEVAERVQDALGAWGKATFEQLFSGQPLLWYDRIRNTGLQNLLLKIASDDPRVLAWPWEALCDPDGSTLAHSCRLERQLSELHDPLPLPEGLAETQVNILLVIARPYGDEDVGFHAVSGPLVDWVREERVAVQIDVLRPPTFAALQERLEARPGHYHIVHFDGHGGYGGTNPASQHTFRGAQGHLVFEDADGSANPITAQKLTTLLAEHRIPIMVLNACQSARIDATAEDPFASTAAALLKAGIRSVVAMGYNLYVSGAQQFVPAFYRRLLQSGNVAEATRAGRKSMLERDQRNCARGEYPLQDWLVPVLYQQESVPLAVHAKAVDAQVAHLPPEAQEIGDYGFIGRQEAIHQLERALLRQPAAAILVHGMAGIGKTTLAKGFLRWLQYTSGVGTAGAPFAGALWFSFDDIRSAEYVINRLVEACFGANAISLPMDRKQSALVKALREQPLLLVWDNFESAAGIAGTEVSPLLVEPDRLLLKDFLKQLRGGRSKVLITSRSSESWLAPTEAFRLPLRGLRGEDAWSYCNAVVRDLGLQIRRDDADILALLEELDGHPLALRSVLLRLVELPARELLHRLKREFAGQAGDDSTHRIFAALALLDQGLPSSFAPILQLIGLHQRYVDIDCVAVMLGLGNEDSHEVLSQCFSSLERGGLLHHVGSGIHRMHPALQGFLARAHAPEATAARGFVDFMAGYADHLGPKQLHEQRVPFALQGANFQHALGLATQHANVDRAYMLTQSLAAFAQNSRDFSTATRLFEAAASLSSDNHEREAAAYHQLGRIAQEQRDLVAAERWYLHSLAISEKRGNEHDAAITYHQLGSIAQEQRDFVAAERWYLRSLAISEKQGNEHYAAGTYHQLGMIAQLQRDFVAAERWYLKSLAIEEKQGNEHGAASTYHQLGMIAELQRDFVAAERWYLQSLTIEEKQGNEHGAAITYHQLGRIAKEQRDFVAAERWYLKSLAINEKQGSEHGAALTLGGLGRLELDQKNYSAAGDWFLKAIAGFAKQAAPHYRDIAINDFVRALQGAPTQVQMNLRERWKAMGFDQLANLEELEKSP